MNLIEASTELEALNEHILISSRKIEYFTHHAERCKRFEDKIRLVILCAGECIKITAIVMLMSKITNSMIPKIPEQKLIEFKGGTMLND